MAHMAGLFALQQATELSPFFSVPTTASNAAKDRKRLTKACDKCRQRKIRCDGGLPCSPCIKSNQGHCCAYETRAKKRGPRQGYISKLEQRLNEIEKMLSAKDELEDPLPSSPPFQEESSEAAQQVLTTPQGSSEKSFSISQLFPPSNHNHLVADSAYNNSGDLSSLSKSDMDQNDAILKILYSNNPIGLDYSTFMNFGIDMNDSNRDTLSSSSSSGSSIMELTAKGDNPPSMDVLPRATKTSRKSLSESDLLGVDPTPVTTHLVNVFFVYMSDSLPIFVETNFWRDFRQKRVAAQVMYALYAIAAPISEHPDIIEAFGSGVACGDVYAKILKGMVQSMTRVPSISNLQALTLLSLRELATGNGPDAWIFNGLALRIAEHLIMSKEEASIFSPVMNFDERVALRRALCTAFSINVAASAATGRNFSLSDALIDCVEDIDEFLIHEMNFLVVIQTAVPPHPVPHSKWANSNFPEHRRTCQDDYILVRMFAIQGRILSFVNSPYRKHTPATMQKYHALLTFFRARLPTSYEIDYDIIDPKQDQLPSNHIITVNLAYYAAVITLHRPMALSGLLKKETNTSYKLCIDAADSILRVIKWTKSINYPVNCALNTFSIFTGGTVYIMKSLDENREQSEIADDLEKLKEIIDYIDELSLMWNIADKQAFFLRSHLNDITKTKSLPSSSPPSSTGQPKTTPPSDIIKLIKKFPTVFSKSDMGFLCYLKYTLLKKGMDSWSGQKSTNGLSPTTMFGKNINKDKVNIDLSDSAESQDDSDDGGVADQDTSKGSDPASSGKKRKTMNSFPPSEQSSETVDVDAGNVHPSAADFGYSEESSQLRTESVMSNSSLNVNVQAHWQSSPSPPISGSFSTANASASKPSPPISADNNASTFTPPAAGGTINFDNLKKFMNRAGGKLDANDYDNFSKQFGSHFSQGQSNSNPLEIHSPPYGGSASESTQNVTSPNSPMHRGMYNGDQHAALSQPMDVYSQVPAVSPNSYSHSNSPSIQNVQYTSPTGQSHNVPSNMSYGLNLSSQNHSNISAPSQTVLGNPFNSMPNTSTASSPFNPMLSNLNMVNQMNMNSNLSFGTSRSPTHNPPSPLNPGNIQTLPQRCVPGNYSMLNMSTGINLLNNQGQNQGYGQYDNIGNNVPGTPNQYYVGHNVNGNEQPGRQNGTSLMNPPTVFSTMMTMPHY